MPKVKISEYSSTANSNTDVASINIDEGCAPSGINNAIRAVMGHLKDFQAGTNGDPFNGPVNGTVGATTPSTVAATTLTTSSTVTHNGGTANGIAYLNGSKVLTTGSALVFDGTNLGVGVTPSAWGGNFKAVQVGRGTALWSGTATDATFLSQNAYYDGTNFRYLQTAYASYYSSQLGQHLWYTAPSGTAGNAISFTQAMTLDASGNLLVGTTSSTNVASGGVSVQPNGFGTGQTVIDIGHITGTASGVSYFRFAYAGSAIGSITQSGTTAVLYNTISDQRLKENIVDADSASSLIDSLKVRQFDWITDKTHQRYGFVAQELVTVAPEAVHQPNDADEMMAVDYSKLVPMLVKEIQSLRKRLAAAGI